MSTPCIICVAITGSLPTKQDNPAVPITINEQVESTHEAFEAGACIVHCHVRDDDGKPTSDPDRFSRLLEALRVHCSGMIVQFSTGGRSGSGRERGGMLHLEPDMASLSVGSNNFPNRVYENSPELVDWLAERMIAHDVKPEVEAFDLSHIVQAARIGPAQLKINEWCIAKGGHTRTGLEDNVRLDRHTLAPSNAALVQRAVHLCDKHKRPVAGWQQARAILGLTGPVK
ncbi:MAG: 3-keto-5-aminohexanoate cleavage protein [Pseudomonadota bacterium]